MAKEPDSRPKPEKKIVEREVECLDLDPQNPRLDLPAKASEQTIIEYLQKWEALDELAFSFHRNGYFWEEPMVVVPADKEEHFIVVEGNRRLATIKLLLNPSLQRKLQVSGFPELNDDQKAGLRKVPTVLYDKRDSVVPYLGFRHITGVKSWEPFAKARYVASLVDAGRSISEIEQTVGDSAHTVRKLYQSFVVFSQIKNEVEMDVSEIKEKFSLLEVVLGQQPIKAFLGMPKRLPEGKIEEVVPSGKLDALREITGYVFGDKKQGLSSILSDSRVIGQRLAPVISDEDALAYLRKTRDLEGAYERSGGEKKYLLKQLTSAFRSIERALGVVPLYKTDSEVKSEVGRILLLIESLKQGID